MSEENGPMVNSSRSDGTPTSSPVDQRRTQRENEDEILGTSPDRTGAVLGWVKSALSPLLSASALMPDELHGLDPFFHMPITEETEQDIQPHINCSYDGCKRRIGPGSSQFGCPGCGLTYCSTHSGHPSFEVQLPEDDGKTRFVRVCLVCWMGRPENQTGLGAERSWANAFSHYRSSVRGHRAEQRAQLETRLAQLIRIEEQETGHTSTTTVGTTVDKRAMQQKVAQWVPDDASHSCSICK